MSKLSQPKNNAGFSLVEIIIATAVIGMIIVSLANLVITIGVIQRQNGHLLLATRIAETKIESLRNNHYNSLPLSPPPLDFTSELPADLAEPRSATVTISEATPGLKRIEVEIAYREGIQTKTVRLSGLLGNIGISQ